MKHTTIISSRLAKSLSTFGMLVALFLIGSASVNAQSTCRTVQGRYTEHTVSGMQCTSAFGLCIEANYTSGPLHGSFFGSVDSIMPSAAVTTTSVLFFTTDSVIHAQLEGKQGDIFVKNTGAFQTAAPGAIMDIQYITGGNGDFTNVSGVLQASGNFDGSTGTGESDYVGTICMP